MTQSKENKAVLRAHKRALIDRLQAHAARATIAAPGKGGGPSDRRPHGTPGAGRELRRLQAALRRIEDGSYGMCMQCGMSIGAERLLVDPSTALCAPCKGVG
jgi:hypothetical protein